MVFQRSLLGLVLFLSTAATQALDGSYGGSWWNPDRAGEGIFFEIIDQDGAAAVVAYFFTYDNDGNQAFLVGQGTADGNTVVLDTVITQGGTFGDAFDAAAVEFIQWGTLTADFQCDGLTLQYQAGDMSGSIALQRFKPAPRGVAGDCAQSSSAAGEQVSKVDGAYYGAWWNPTRAGEGIFMEIWEDALGMPQLFSAWFTYDPDGSGRQRWVVGEGPLVGNRADLAAIVTRGPSFGEAYDAAQVIFENWGYFSVVFTACGEVQVSFDADGGFGSGKLQQEPFLLPMAGAPACRPEVLDYRDQVIYFAFTDRFANGDTSNDNGEGDRAGDTLDKSNPLGWHGGDFAGIEQKIVEGYFSNLGVTTLWISPVMRQVGAVGVDSGPNQGESFAGYHAYWGDTFERIEPHFGTPEDLKRLVSAAHRNGIRVIFDTVVNHVGYGSNLLNSNPEWLRSGSSCGGDDRTLCLAGLPDFRQDVPEATAFLNDRVRFWMEDFGADGMRMDTMKHVDDEYWLQFFVPGGAGDPARWWTVGEVFNTDPGYLARFPDELGSPSVFDFALQEAIRDGIGRGQGVAPISTVFSQDGRYEDPTKLTTFIDNHDMTRIATEGERALIPPAIVDERVGLALGLIYFARGTPSVYYGTEIAMRGRGDPYDHPLGTSNREDMDFDALDDSFLDERLAALAAARKSSPVLKFGSQQPVSARPGGSDVLVFARTLDGLAPVVVVLNNDDDPVNLGDFGGGINVANLLTDGAALVELTGESHSLAVSGGRLSGQVPARTILALSSANFVGQAGSEGP